MNSQIDIMIKQLCPNGVEKVKLGEVCTCITGGDTPEDCVKGQKEPSKEYPYPVYANGDETYGYASHYRIDKPAVTISSIGNVGTAYYREPYFIPIIRLKTFIPNDDSLNVKFLYYCLTVMDFIGTNSSLSSMKAADFKKIVIPLPPLTIQQEIVKILDKFTSLIDKIDEEINLRQKQYEYYREKLLTFEDGECEWKKLSDLCIISAGGDAPDGCIKGQAEPSEDCPYPVFSNGKDNDALYGYAPDCRIKVRAITIAARGSIGYHTVREAYFTPIIRLITLTPKVKDINLDYINLALCLSLISGTEGGIPQLTVPMVKKIIVPIPSKENQQSIVQTLDKFETLISQLKDERALRQKQYEYYREKLLSF